MLYIFEQYTYMRISIENSMSFVFALDISDTHPLIFRSFFYKSGNAIYLPTVVFKIHNTLSCLFML